MSESRKPASLVTALLVAAVATLLSGFVVVAVAEVVDGAKTPSWAYRLSGAAFLAALAFGVAAMVILLRKKSLWDSSQAGSTG